MPLRKIVAASLMSPFIVSCVNSFRDAYARTGMNLVQSIIIVVVGIAQWGGRALRGPARQAKRRQA
jgi:hypothetical protein